MMLQTGSVIIFLCHWLANMVVLGEDAVAASMAFTDLICVYSKGKSNFTVSAHDILTCNKYAKTAAGAFDMWLYEGIATGGGYESKEGCKPWQMEPNYPHFPGPCDPERCIPRCLRGTNEYYHYSKSFAQFTEYIHDMEKVQKAIMSLGVVVADMDLHQNLLEHKSGIYTCGDSPFVRRTSVKIVGWGRSGDVPYWIAGNTFGPEWGEGGFFKIRRGTNECKMEWSISYGAPYL